MINKLRQIIPDTHPIRLLYHKSMSFLAALYYRFPSENMVVVGVTGTNGKTTTVNLITGILNAAGLKAGMASTINFQIGEKRWVNATKQSTLSPFKLQKLLREMVNDGCKYAVIEVTSHALTQSRVSGINFDVALITNVTADHVEYHGDFNGYLSAKGKLFRMVSRGRRKPGVPRILVLNADDQYYNFFNQHVADRKITYGMKMAVVYSENVEKNPKGSKFILHVPNHAIPIKLSIPGDFNVYNALAAASLGLALGVSLDAIKKGLEGSILIPGRFEHVNCGQKYSIVVDYAHAPDSLEALLALYRKLTPGRLFAVFGATGGGRDKGKRPIMGEVAHNISDYIILTDDDPYSEDEIEIIEQIARGIPREEGHNFWKIPDRREAIRLALTLAREGDSVIVSGKGCEEIMKVRGKTIPWSDKQVITELLERPCEIEINESFEKRENVCLES